MLKVKKWLAGIIAGILAISLTACGGAQDTAGSNYPDKAITIMAPSGAPLLRKALAGSALVLYSRDIFVAYFPLYATSLNISIDVPLRESQDMLNRVNESYRNLDHKLIYWYTSLFFKFT